MSVVTATNTVGKIRWVYPSGSSVEIFEGAKTINDGIWHFVVFVKNGNVNTGYIDTVQDFNITASYSTSPSSDSALIGTLSSGYFSGLIDEVRIYEEALTTSQVQQLYAQGLKQLLAKSLISQDEYNQRMAEIK
jgi:hypothetical protein